MKSSNNWKEDWIGLTTNNSISYYAEKNKEIKGTNILLITVRFASVWGRKMSTVLLFFWLNLKLGFRRVMYWQGIQIKFHWHMNRGFFFPFFDFEIDIQ